MYNQRWSLIHQVHQVNCLDTIGNIFAITGVQLELGPVATPFEHRLYSAELALCQRYYEQYTVAGGAAIGIGYAYSTVSATVIPKRANPSVPTYTGPLTLLQTGGGITITGISNVGAYSGVPSNAFGVTVASGLTAGQGCTLYANAGACTLAISAEL